MSDVTVASSVSLTPQHYEKVRQSPLYMAHTKKRSTEVAEDFVATMLSQVTEPLTEQLTESTADDEGEEEEGGHEMMGAYLQQQMGEMWAEALIEGGAFDGVVEAVTEDIDSKPSPETLENLRTLRKQHHLLHLQEEQQAVPKQVKSVG